jgi:hypothetical protein
MRVWVRIAGKSDPTFVFVTEEEPFIEHLKLAVKEKSSTFERVDTFDISVRDPNTMGRLPSNSYLTFSSVDGRPRGGPDTPFMLDHIGARNLSEKCCKLI